METTDFMVQVESIGFEPGKDISDGYWKMAISQFTAMYNQYANMTNQIMDSLNYTWQRYERIREFDDISGNRTSTDAVRAAMEINEKTTYGDWMERWLKECCKAVDAAAAISGFLIRTDIFRDGDLPMFGVKFRNKPEWKIRFSLAAK